MNDFEGLLSSDYGFKPQGKSAPMASAKSNSSSNSTFNYEIGGGTKKSSSGSFLDDHDTLFRSTSSGNRRTQEFNNIGGLDDVFGGAADAKSKGNSTVNLDSIFGGGEADSGSRFSSLPVFDKPVYDDEVFEGTSGLKSSSSVKYEDIFTSSSSSYSKKKNDAFDDLLGGFGRKDPESKSSDSRGPEKGTSNFDDLLPGFGGSTVSSDRASSGSSKPEKGAVNSAKKPSNSVDDPFVVLDSPSPAAPSPSGLYSDPLEQFSKLSGGSSTKIAESASVSGGVFDDLDPLDGFGKSIPTFSSDKNDREKVGSPARVRSTVSGTGQYSVRSPERGPEKKMAADEYQESPHDVFDMPSFSADSNRSVPNVSSPPYVSVGFDEPSSQGHVSPNSADNVDSSEEIWLTVSEIPLFTEPTAAAPPSRPPPPRPVRSSKVGGGSYAPPYTKKNADESSQFSHSSTYFDSLNSASVGANNSFSSPIDELEEFGMRSNRNNFDYNADFPSGEDVEANSDAAASAAAMKEAMDRAEAKFRHAKGVRERENAKAARVQHERGEMPDVQERDYRDRLERERQLKEREEEEKRMKEEEEEEKRRIEKLREEKVREERRRERERELARQAVEKATREARERASIEARTRAEKAQTEARQRAERAAVQRAQAEARERAARAAVEAKEKAEREAREKAKAEAKEKEAREKAAAAAKASQQKNENDLDSFFGMGSRASSAPRPRASSSDPFFDAQFQSKQSSEAARASVNSTSNIRKASSSASIVDDLSSIFGGAPSAGEFQDVEGETEERRRARLERHQRTKERAAKALAEKNQRDLDTQREQAERHRIAETLDVEIKRWSTGKEGNLRALLSTLQYVLWPECGWQPVSLTDLITAASVKKVYRKATLCIHPDKVQQKGANLQQKYIAEKVFDLLKEAWNKFNSEELF